MNRSYSWKTQVVAAVLGALGAVGAATAVTNVFQDPDPSTLFDDAGIPQRLAIEGTILERNGTPYSGTLFLRLRQLLSTEEQLMFTAIDSSDVNGHFELSIDARGLSDLSWLEFDVGPGPEVLRDHIAALTPHEIRRAQGRKRVRAAGSPEHFSLQLGTRRFAYPDLLATVLPLTPITEPVVLFLEPTTSVGKGTGWGSILSVQANYVASLYSWSQWSDLWEISASFSGVSSKQLTFQQGADVVVVPGGPSTLEVSVDLAAIPVGSSIAIFDELHYSPLPGGLMLDYSTAVSRCFSASEHHYVQEGGATVPFVNLFSGAYVVEVWDTASVRYGGETIPTVVETISLNPGTNSLLLD